MYGLHGVLSTHSNILFLCCVLQIFIGFTQKILDSVPHSYDDIVDELDKNDMSKTCATVILQALNQKGNKPLAWLLP